MSIHYKALGHSLLSLLTGILIAGILAVGLSHAAILLNRQLVALTTAQAQSAELELLADTLAYAVKSSFSLGCLADGLDRSAMRVTSSSAQGAPNLTHSQVLDILIADHESIASWEVTGSIVVISSDELHHGSLLAATNCNHPPIHLDKHWYKSNVGYWLPLCRQNNDLGCFNPPSNISSGYLIPLTQARFYVRKGSPNTLYKQTTKTPLIPRWHSEQLGIHDAQLHLEALSKGLIFNIALPAGAIENKVVNVTAL